MCATGFHRRCARPRWKVRKQLSQSEILEPFRTQLITKSGAVVEVWMTATALLNAAGKMYAIATTERARETKSGAAKPQKGGD
jgi:two-component system, chemotaxis family, CheB/CheR fusion protein